MDVYFSLGREGNVARGVGFLVYMRTVKDQVSSKQGFWMKRSFGRGGLCWLV